MFRRFANKRALLCFTGVSVIGGGMGTWCYNTTNGNKFALRHFGKIMPTAVTLKMYNDLEYSYNDVMKRLYINYLGTDALKVIFKTKGLVGLAALVRKGDVFNEIIGNHPLIRLTNKLETHRGFKYNTGLNTDVNDFNPNCVCCAGGLYFTDVVNFPVYFNHTNDVYWRIVTIPADSMVHVELNGQAKTNAFVLKDRNVILPKFNEECVNTVLGYHKYRIRIAKCFLDTLRRSNLYNEFFDNSLSKIYVDGSFYKVNEINDVNV